MDWLKGNVISTLLIFSMQISISHFHRQTYVFRQGSQAVSHKRERGRRTLRSRPPLISQNLWWIIQPVVNMGLLSLECWGLEDHLSVHHCQSQLDCTEGREADSFTASSQNADKWFCVQSTIKRGQGHANAEGKQQNEPKAAATALKARINTQDRPQLQDSDESVLWETASWHLLICRSQHLLTSHLKQPSF